MRYQAEDNIQGAPIQDSMTAVHQQAALLAGTTMAHRVFGLFTKSVTLIADQGNDHAVEVEEEHQEVEAKLDERFLKYEFESVIARQIVNQENRPSCAHSACGKSRSHLGGAGYRRSYNSKETQVRLGLGVRGACDP
jgi:hypothetical protein